MSDLSTFIGLKLVSISKVFISDLPLYYFGRMFFYLGIDRFHIFEKQSFCFKNNKEKTKQKMIVFKKDHFFKNIFFFKQSFSKTIVFRKIKNETQNNRFLDQF